MHLYWGRNPMLAGMLACTVAIESSHAGENDATKAFADAMRGDDAQAKRAAMAAATSGPDDEALPLLIQAVADRQTHDLAVQALRSRTGLKPVRFNRGSGYPGYPTSDDAASWQAWYVKWSADHDRKMKIDAAIKRLSPGPESQSPPLETPEMSTPDAHVPGRRIPTGDLGRLDRIVYTSGRTLIAYKRSIRLDADGKLVSIRIVHRDGTGEESIDGRLIARIEEDIEVSGSP